MNIKPVLVGASQNWQWHYITICTSQQAHCSGTPILHFTYYACIAYSPVDHSFLVVVSFPFSKWISTTACHSFLFVLFFLGCERGDPSWTECEQLPRHIGWKLCPHWENRWPTSQWRVSHHLQDAIWRSEVCRPLGQGIPGGSWNANSFHLSTSKGLPRPGTMSHPSVRGC